MRRRGSSRARMRVLLMIKTLVQVRGRGLFCLAYAISLHCRDRRKPELPGEARVSIIICLMCALRPQIGRAVRHKAAMRVKALVERRTSCVFMYALQLCISLQKNVTRDALFATETGMPSRGRIAFWSIQRA